jgi:hypothetical protein
LAVNLLTFATWRYEKSRQRLVRSAQKFGGFHCWNYSDKEFRTTEIYARNPSITRVPRGAGLWLWKSYYILQVLKELNDGDPLIYLDAGIEIIAPLGPLLALTEHNKGIALFKVHERLNRHWTKRDCFALMDCDSPEYRDTEQTMSGIIVLRKSPFIVDLVQEWLQFNSDVRIVSDLPNTCGLPNYDGFVAHRHDQSILNNLRIKYRIAGYTDPTQFGEPYRANAVPGVDDYPALLNLHRERLPSWRTALKLAVTDRGRFTQGVRQHIRRIIGLDNSKRGSSSD